MLARPHLIVAAVGTVALLGMSCTAIWLVLPGDPSEKIVTAATAAPAAEQPADAAKAEVDDSTTTATAAAPRSIDMTGKPAAATAAAPPKLATVTSPEPLDQTDPRWKEQKAAAAKARSTVAATKTDSLTSAYAEEPKGQADDGATAAIQAAKPKAAASAVKTAMVKPEAKPPAPEADDATEGRASRAARAVTMRAKPGTGGKPIGTVPARADVRVISCDQWCQIVYKGKRGYVYRSFLERNGR